MSNRQSKGNRQSEGSPRPTGNRRQVIPLDLGPDSYDITVSYGLRERLGDELSSWNNGQRWVVLSQPQILQHYQGVVDGLQNSGINLGVIEVPGDESAKNIAVAEKVWSEMVEMGCDRSSILLALGGGVVGDLGGFVAATYMRGITIIQVPTTLLAMIDSAIGGKTAVNLAAGKNLVGAIHQPGAVIIDPGFLATLPRRNVVSSLAEAVKYGFIRDRSIFDIFESRFEQLLELRDQALLTEIIVKSCRIKSRIVANDQFENGERRLLNYGHTIGHAFETLRDYGGLYHGEAVLFGMKCANYISHKKGLLSSQQYLSAQAVLDRFPLPELGQLSPQQVLDVVQHDKKNVNGKLNFILLEGIGNAVVSTDVSSDDIVDSLSVVNR
ncbi:MAG: 3-dehydroquinate synthase [Arenicella sp.]|nr:3-dehydroquinate synthase [Arenicella sp.]